MQSSFIDNIWGGDLTDMQLISVIDIFNKYTWDIPLKDKIIQHAIEIYSTLNEGKSVVAERFIRTLKNKIYKYLIQYQKMCILTD